MNAVNPKKDFSLDGWIFGLGGVRSICFFYRISYIIGDRDSEQSTNRIGFGLTVSLMTAVL